MKYRVEIDFADRQAVVTINGGPVRYFDTLSEAKVFVDGLFYDGYPREDLINTSESAS
jgi:hypothetical protein